MIINSYKYGVPFSFGNALDFDGVDDIVTFSAISLDLTDGYTVSFWVKLNSFNSVIFQGTSSTDYIFINSSSSVRVRDDVNDRTFNFASAMATGTWHHVLLSVNSSNQGRCYIDGVESTSGALTLSSALEFIQLSRVNFELDGAIDEIAIWDNATATAGNVASLYNSGSGALASDVIASPNRYYRCDSSSGTTLIDEGTDGANGTLSNFSGTYWVAH